MEKIQKPALIHRILLNRPLRIVITLTLFGILLPPLVYVLFFSREFGYPDGLIIGTCGHSVIHHIPCGKSDISKSMCILRGCCYTNRYGCYHFYPSQYQYIIPPPCESNNTLQPLRSMTTLGETSQEIQVCITELTKDRLKIELGLSSIPCLNESIYLDVENSTTNYEYKIDDPTFIVKVNDKNTGRPLLSSSRGPLIVSERYFEWTLYLGTDVLLGLGDYMLDKRPFKKLLIINEKENFVPYILAYDRLQNSFHAIIFESYGPIEIEITQSSVVIFRSLSSKLFSVNLLMGPSMSNILKQINDMTTSSGNIEFPYWHLGIHVCRSSTNGNIAESIDDFNEFLQTATEHDIPFDSHCLEENLMLFHSHTDRITDDFMKAIELLKKNSKKFVLSMLSQLEVDENEAYYEAATSDILLRKGNTNTPYLGKLNDKKVAYIDWSSSSRVEEFLLKYFPPSLAQSADAFHLQNNCLRDDTLGVKQPNRNLYQYIPEGFKIAAQRLIPASSRLSQFNESHGIMQLYNTMPINYANVMQEFILKNGPVALSNYNMNSPRTNNHAMVSENYGSTWPQLQEAFKKLLSDSIAGIRLTGSLVCGNRQEMIDEELCIRWYQLASVAPVFEVYTLKTPNTFSGTAMDIMTSAINKRYSLLAYIYTILLLTNETVIRPLFYHYLDVVPFNEVNSEQFLLGAAIIIAPVLQPAALEKKVYMPNHGFEIWGGQFMGKGTNNFSVTKKDLPIAVLIGHIVPLHTAKGSQTATKARKTSLKLIVALNCTQTTENAITKTCTASGKFAISKSYYWIFYADDEKLTLSFSIQSDKEQMCADSTECTTSLSQLRIYGINNGTKIVNLKFDLCEHSTVFPYYYFYYD